MVRRTNTPDAAVVVATALAALAFLATAPASGTALAEQAVGVSSAQGQASAQAGDPGRKVIVSLEKKHLWLVQGRDTLFSAPVAIGKGTVFTFAGKSYRFDTPRGDRRILAKLDDPNWIPPDWHYYEKAVYRGLEPIHLEDGDRFELSDGTHIEVRNKEVGRVNRWGNYHPFTPGSEIMFDGYIFIPPFGSPQRHVPNALGPVKLSLGDGYLIHGTHRYNEQSIGSAASHGCIRMTNDDVAKLRDMVEVGTLVHIY
jgi:hypothetical protein